MMFLCEVKAEPRYDIIAPAFDELPVCLPHFDHPAEAPQCFFCKFLDTVKVDRYSLLRWLLPLKPRSPWLQTWNFTGSQVNKMIVSQLECKSFIWFYHVETTENFYERMILKGSRTVPGSLENAVKFSLAFRMPIGIRLVEITWDDATLALSERTSCS